MIIWSKFGILVPIIVFSVSLLTELCVESITNNDLYHQDDNSWFYGSLVISAVIIYYLAKNLDQRESKVYIDKETQEEVIMKEQHTFFFIPMKYWSLILLVYAVFSTLQDILKFLHIT